MASNDEVVWGLPQIQCPTCQNALQLDRGNMLHKLSKEQRKRKYGDGSNCTQSSTRDRLAREPNIEDVPAENAENTFVVVTCDNERCPQYNKVKVLRIPRLSAPSVKLDL